MIKFCYNPKVMEIIIPFLATYLIILMFLASIYIFRRKLDSFFIRGFASYGITKIIETLIKGLFYIPRPYIALGKPSLALFPPTDSSFPSGHASSAFLLATIIFLYNKRLGIVFYIIAVMIGVGRVLALVHYPIDIAGGALLGISSALIINRIYKISR